VKSDISLLKYIGRPYEKYNCFDLAKEFYMDFFKIDIKHYFEGDEKDVNKLEVQTLIVSNKGDFVRVEGKPQFGDIVVVKLYGFECHIGVCVNSSQFLHSAKKIGSSMDRLERYSRMIAGFYRHKAHA
jgi:hypothetical protein